jgi:hypothetical protein
MRFGRGGAVILFLPEAAPKLAAFENRIILRDSWPLKVHFRSCHGTVQIIRAQVQKQSPK